MHIRLKRHSIAWLLLLVFAAVLGGIALSQDNPPLYDLPSGRVYTGGSMVLTQGGRTLVVTNMLNNTVSIAEPLDGIVRAEIPVGRDPRAVVLTPDDSRALVVNRGDGTLSIINIAEATVTATYPLGILPYGIVTDNDETAYVALQGSDEIIEIDLSTGTILTRIPVPDAPVGLALWGNFLYVTHLWSGDFTLVYVPDARVVETLSTGAQTGLSFSIIIDPDAGRAFLPQTRSNASNPALTYDNTVTPVVNVVDLRRMALLRTDRLALDIVDRPVNMPYAAAYDRIRRWLYVVNAGSNDVSVIDINTGLSVGHITVDSNPRGAVFSRDNAFLYVHSAIDGTVTVIETRNLSVRDRQPVSDLQVPVDVLIGAQLFHGADDARLSTNHFISCASCHFDGQSDGRVWAVAPGVRRNTPVLFDLLDTAPYTAAGQWDELGDVEVHIRRLQTGFGLLDGVVNPVPADMHSGISPDLDILTAYLGTLLGPSNPLTTDDELVARGAVVFEEQGCSTCHSGALGTDVQQHDVGTGGLIDTPPLRWLWMSAPYFHDGSADDLTDVFILPGEHRLITTVSLDDIDALVAYLLNLP